MSSKTLLLLELSEGLIFMVVCSVVVLRSAAAAAATDDADEAEEDEVDGALVVRPGGKFAALASNCKFAVSSITITDRM